MTTSSTTARKRILVVDDDPSIVALVVRALERSCEVHTAGDAGAALAILDAIGVPDLVICDVMMPQVDGFQFVRALRHEKTGFERVPVIFLTARTHPLDVVEGINAGARHYIAKPFTLPDLVATVAHILR